MKPRVLTTEHGQFEQKDWSGFNNSGIRPIGDKVLLLVDKAMGQTKGGVLLPEDTEERQSLSSTTGIVVAKGDLAFQWHPELAISWGENVPQVGDRVYFEKYSGQVYSGHDGQTYRLVSDKCIGGVSMPPEFADFAV